MVTKRIHLTGLQYRGAVEQGPNYCVLKSIIEFALRHTFHGLLLAMGTDGDSHTKAGTFGRPEAPMKANFGLRTPQQPCRISLRWQGSQGCFHPISLLLPFY